jgi:superfamily I DNA/RNA helicase
MLKSKQPPTKQQERLWRHLTEGDQHLLVEARAGSGKSFSCREGMKRLLAQDLHLRIRYGVFNRSAADEFSAATNLDVEVKTLHAFGLSALKAACPRVQVEKHKSYHVLDTLPSASELPRWLRGPVAQLVSHAKNAALRPNGDGADNYQRLEQLLVHFDLQCFGQTERVIETALEVLRRSARKTGMCDFDDMLWLPYVLDARFPSCDWFFFDEVQDLNRVQHRLIPRMCPSGRVVAVGDSRQAIYAFRGADARSMANLERKLSRSPLGVKKLPLTVTFRCPVSHVLLANELVPDLQARPGAPEGVIRRGVPVEQCIAEVLPGDRVLCPFNAPVISAALKLIATRRRALVLGRAVGQSLLEIVRDCGNARTIADLSHGVTRWRDRELKRLEDMDGVDDLKQSVQDRHNGLQAVLRSCRCPAEVEPCINDLFADKDAAGAVIFSTVHRAKGSEAERIWLIDTPSRQPTTDWEARQQENLRYVALTRSKHLLAFVVPPGDESNP